MDVGRKGVNQTITDSRAGEKCRGAGRHAEAVQDRGAAAPASRHVQHAKRCHRRLYAVGALQGARRGDASGDADGANH